MFKICFNTCPQDAFENIKCTEENVHFPTFLHLYEHGGCYVGTPNRLLSLQLSNTSVSMTTEDFLPTVMGGGHLVKVCPGAQPKLASVARRGLPSRPTGPAENRWTLEGRPHKDTVHHRRIQPCPPSSYVVTLLLYYYIIKTPAANNNVTMSPSTKEGRRDDKSLHAQSLDLLVELDL